MASLWYPTFLASGLTSPRLSYSHTHPGKSNWKMGKLSFCLATHTERKKKRILPFISLWWFSHSAPSISPPTFNLYGTHVFTDLQNLNEIYIRKSPRRGQTRCLQPKRRANKQVIWKDTYLIYKVSKLVRWLWQLLTFLRVNCNSWVVVNTLNAIFELIPSWPWRWARFEKINWFSVNCTTQ